MVRVSPYKEKINDIENEEDVKNKFFETLIKTNRTPDFFVDWKKIKEHVEKYKDGINLLNGLIGPYDIEYKKRECKRLLKKWSSEILPVIPLILAIRDVNIDVINDLESENITYESLNFSSRKIKENEIKNYVSFCERSGILNLFNNIKNLRDYLLGVEVGMDTNARKNRSGSIMEKLVEKIIERYNLEYIPQATKKKIENKFKIEIPIHKTNKRFDFAVLNNNRLYLIEVNFYSTGGSKLKSTAGEYIEVFEQLKNKNVTYIWITDGYGWITTKNAIEEAFEKMDYILNLYYIKKGVLNAILNLSE